MGVVPQEMISICLRVQDILCSQAGYYGIPRIKALADSD